VLLLHYQVTNLTLNYGVPCQMLWTDPTAAAAADEGDLSAQPGEARVQLPGAS